MNTRVVFDADTVAWRKNLRDAVQSLLDTGKASDVARAKILQNMELQVTAALEAGKSYETISKMQERAASQLTTVTEENAAKRIKAADNELTKLKAVNAELERMGRVKAPVSESGHGFTDRMATSAVVRSLDGNPGIRSIENTLTLIPGLTSAAMGLAPIIGAAGLAGLFVEMGEKGEEAFEKVEKASEATRTAFAAMHEQAQISIDDKELENQKLQDQIDKISGHPNNGVATALLEAKKMADQLLVSLQADRKQLEELFKQQDTGWMGKAMASLGFGPDPTGSQQKQILGDFDGLQKNLRDAKTTYSKSFSDASDDAAREAATKAYNKSVHDAFQSRIDTYAKERKRLEVEQATAEIHQSQYGPVVTTHDNSEKIANINGVMSILQDRQASESLDESIYSRGKQLGGLHQGKDAGEAQRKAAEAQMKAFELADAQLKAKYADSRGELLGAESAFWEKMAHSADVLPANQTAVLDKYTSSAQAFNSFMDEEARKAVAAQKQQQQAQQKQWDNMHAAFQSAGQRSADDEVVFWWMRMQEADAGSQNYLHALEKYNAAEADERRQGIELQKQLDRDELSRAQQQGKAREATLELQRRQGQINPHDYSVQQANIHTQQYHATDADLQKQLKDANDSNIPLDIDRAQQAIIQNDANRAVQIMEDAANIVSTTWKGALKNSLGNWVQDATDSAQQVVQVTQQAINGLNENLADLMVGDKSNFAGMFKGIGKTLANDSLKQLEGHAMKALGIGGKADGSQENPFWVRTASGGVGGAFGKGMESGLSGLFSDSKSGGGSGGSGIFSDGLKAGIKSLFSDSSTGSGGDFAKGMGSGLTGLFSDSDTATASAAPGFFSKFFTNLFGGGEALGGPVAAGVPIDVGEMGRERFVPSTSGTIIPNNKLGNGGNTYYSIDTGGVSSAEVDMRVRSALSQYHTKVMPHGARQAVADGNSRRSGHK